MSWDIFVQDLPADVRSVADIPSDFEPATIGGREELIQRIKSIAPAADFSDPAWGVLEAASFSVEFNFGDEDPVRSFAMHVRGDDAAAAFISELLTRLGLRALDPQSDSGLFEPGGAAEQSLRRWRAYRDRVCD